MSEPTEYNRIEPTKAVDYSYYHLHDPYDIPPPPPPPPPLPRRRWLIPALICIACLVALVAGFVGALFLTSSRTPQKTETSMLAPTPTATPSPSLYPFAKNVANQYYQAVTYQEYDTAYTYLHSNLITRSGVPLTKDLYVAAALSLDQEKGLVRFFRLTDLSVTTDTVNITVTVERENSSSYDVHLGLRQENGEWKITSYDNI